MSVAIALIKFKRTGNIYYGCYEGTSDVLLPFICTPEECYDEKDDSYHAISYCRNLRGNYDYVKFPEDVIDLDDVEIYSDYGGGFCWSGTGSESLKRIKGSLMPYEDSDIWKKMTRGQPKWVTEFFKHLEVDET